jgi:hypothetical protein
MRVETISPLNSSRQEFKSASIPVGNPFITNPSGYENQLDKCSVFAP